ncbi:hypothetical protein SmJEL517_g05900 [Synchytrium microbalum]|uniref:non-specific serine/threonine protein kinase n=1 Tax=Synchytrium microbalum TaxID=1806994 RepID=A0A507BTF1_9FUNG|nr:uncharacterized protein SmJEL517_g05900 [Synchytrium microbalum]TPX30561.1 hypothetical protein SmJEL517_g05900 [Synchytrium microbalum]
MEGVLIKQGAEARVYKIPFLNHSDAIVKERFAKSYRHPLLDQKITARRVVQEARSLVRCCKAGIDTPTLYLIDVPKSLLYMEYIDGQSVRDFIHQGGLQNEQAASRLSQQIGWNVASIHDLDLIHGDLTTSNMMIRPQTQSVVMIDFGLSYQSTDVEDKAVDLYVLERAFSSTHPNTEAFFETILENYKDRVRDGKSIITRLNDVRKRGRKRTAFG